MTTAPRIYGSGPRPGRVGAAVRPALLATLAVGLVACILGALLSGSAAVLGAVIATAMVALFFGVGAVVLDLVAGVAPAASLLIALLTYTVKVVLVGAVFVALNSSGALESTVDPRWLAGTLITATFSWLAAQIRTNMRARIPLYSLPDDGSGTVSRAKEAGAR